jgi:predicted RNase H-related nuclease YkuK (DUF458 family)
VIPLEEIKRYILGMDPSGVVYLGVDSERILKGGVWIADYALVVVVHIEGNKGCRVFGGIVRERDFDPRMERPRLRLMKEVYLLADLYLSLEEVLVERRFELHLDINPNELHTSSLVLNEAVGYIKGVCGVSPVVKPRAFAASCAADRLKHILRKASEEK